MPILQGWGFHSGLVSAILPSEGHGMSGGMLVPVK